MNDAIDAALNAEFERGYLKGAADCAGSVAKMDAQDMEINRLRQRLSALQAEHERLKAYARHIDRCAFSDVRRQARRDAGVRLEDPACSCGLSVLLADSPALPPRRQP